MPVNGTPISEGLSRADGINIDTESAVDITNTKALTVYYLGGEEDSYYYVPVTKRVDNEAPDDISSIINELAAGPEYGSGLHSEFQANVKLLENPKIDDGKVTLDFNESIYGSFKEKIVSEHALNTLVLSLTEQKGIESVAVTVNGKAEPVTRPEKVNTGSF
jgi:germination protein M